MISKSGAGGGEGGGGGRGWGAPRLLYDNELYLRDKALNHHIIPIQGFAVLVLR